MSDTAQDVCPSDTVDLYQRHLEKLGCNGYSDCGVGGTIPQIKPQMILRRCRHCGAAEMRPSGACHVCLECGETTGCS